MNVWYRNIVLEIYFLRLSIPFIEIRFLSRPVELFLDDSFYFDIRIVNLRFCSEWNRLCYSVWNGICWRKTILQMESERSPGGSWRVTRRITNDEMHSMKDSVRNRIFPRQVSTHEERHGFFRGVSFVEWTFQLLFWVGVLCRIVCSFALTSFLEMFRISLMFWARTLVCDSRYCFLKFWW